MKLDRNINKDGTGKYALILQRHRDSNPEVFDQALKILLSLGALDEGNTAKGNFFVIRLKDKYAAPALAAYALAASEDDQEWASEVMELAKLALTAKPKKRPD